MVLLDKLLPKLKERDSRVLIFSQVNGILILIKSKYYDNFLQACEWFQSTFYHLVHGTLFDSTNLLQL